MTRTLPLDPNPDPNPNPDPSPSPSPDPDPIPTPDQGLALGSGLRALLAAPIHRAPRRADGAHPVQELTLTPTLSLTLTLTLTNPHPHPNPNPNQALTPPKSDVKLIWRAQATDAKFRSYRNSSEARFGAAEPPRPQP